MRHANIGQIVGSQTRRDMGANALPCVPASLDIVKHLPELVTQTARPCVLTTERELSVLRRGLTKEGWKRALYLQPAPDYPEMYPGAGLLSVANRCLDVSVVIPQTGGDLAGLYCDCGKRPPMHVMLQTAKEYQCPACGNILSGKKFDAAIRHLQHRKLAGEVLALALVYAIEKDNAYANKACEILLQYAKVYSDISAKGHTNGIIRQSAWEAFWAIPLAQAYDILCCSRSLNDSDKEYVTQKLFGAIAKRLRSEETLGYFGAWRLSAVGVIGFAIKKHELVQYALDAYRDQLSDQVGEDGLWKGVPQSQHFAALVGFVHLAEACYRSGIDIYNWQVKPGRSLKAMFAAPLQHIYPSFRFPAIGNTLRDSIQFLPLHLYEIISRRCNDSAFASVIKKGYKYQQTPINNDQREHAEFFTRASFFAFLFGRDLPGRLVATPAKTSDSSSLGMCTLRSGDDLMLTLLHSQPANKNHQDNLSFTLYANDSVIVPDFGTAPDGCAIRDWHMSTSAHNTVVVDRESQRPTGKSGLSKLCAGSYAQFAQAQSRDAYPGVTHTRRILAIGNACIIDDHLTSLHEHEYDWHMRCEGVPEVIGEYKPSKFSIEGYSHTELDQAWRIDDDFRVDLECERGSLSLCSWAMETPIVAAIGSCPAETATRRVPLIIQRTYGANARFLTVLAASRAGAVRLIKESSTITIACSGQNDHVYMRNGAPECASSQLETDGDVAVVRMRGGRVLSIGLMGGSWVKFNGEMLLECPAIAECVEASFEERHLNVNYNSNTAGTLKIKTNARAMRINGYRTNAVNSEGKAILRVTPQMLANETS